jgi:hypothetical protein
MLAIVSLLCPSILPPQYSYLSARKRLAVRLALGEFAKTYTALHGIRPKNMASGIYRTEADRCIVMIPQASCIHPPVLTFYAVPDGSDRAIFLGAGQCHWGIRAEDVWKSEPRELPAVVPGMRE